MARHVKPSIDQRGQRCYRCGCRNDVACVDQHLVPCHWISPTLCSHCYECVPAWKPGMVVYSAMWFPDKTLSIAARFHIVDRSGRSPVIGREQSRAVVRRPELLTAGRDTFFDALAVALLADCLQDDTQAVELYPLFAQELLSYGAENWSMNEFQIRTWVSANTVPY